MALCKWTDLTSNYYFIYIWMMWSLTSRTWPNHTPQPIHNALLLSICLRLPHYKEASYKREENWFKESKRGRHLCSIYIHTNKAYLNWKKRVCSHMLVVLMMCLDSQSSFIPKLNLCNIIIILSVRCCC